jgi:mannose-6-phosphate isomerase-like protein (cupin superfamily)
MRFIPLVAAAMTLVAANSAIAQAPGALVHVGDAEVRALIEKVEKERQPGQMVASAPILRHGASTALLEYRVGPGTVNVHDDAEFFHVIEGSGTLITGGTVVEPKRSGANITGTDIVGGVSRTVKAGDVFLVPEDTPHWFKAIDGKLVMISVHLPRADAAPKP